MALYLVGLNERSIVASERQSATDVHPLAIYKTPRQSRVPGAEDQDF
jgi:hypothetical protein